VKPETMTRTRKAVEAPAIFGLVRAAAAFLLLSAPLAAQNLVRNGTFDTDTSGWNVEEAAGSLAWSSLDAEGSSSSGSAVVVNASPGPENGTGIVQCVSGPGVEGGTRYAWGGRVRIPSGQARTGAAFLGLRWYASTDCTGSPLDQPRLSTLSLDVWAALTETDIAPAGTRSVEFLAFPSKIEAGGELQVLYDELFFGPSGGTLTIPSAASIHGVSGTFFHTDLWVMNLSRTNTQTVSARFHCFRGQTCSGDSRDIDLAPRATALLQDVVGDLFGSPETAGAIELTYDASLGGIAATSRTYTPSLPAPTAGAAVPAAGPGEARARALFLGLGSNARVFTSGFRTNAGVYNPNGAAVSVTFSLLDGDGAPLGAPLTRFASSLEAFQINDIFTAVGAGGTVTVNATLVVTATAPVFPFVTVIDNQSGDFIWVTPVDDP
jgi:hypothetical protein